MPGHRPNKFNLPVCPIERQDYEALYAFNHGTDDFQEVDSAWHVIHIPPGLTEDDAYRLLPSAPDFEYGGYLTRTRIRFRKCGSIQTNTLKSRPCTFHSHPTDLVHADLPTVNDVYMFLACRHLRAVTVGATQLWVWDKTSATLATVRKLATWVEANQLKEVRRLEKQFPYVWHEPYMKLILKNLGLVWPKNPRDLKEHWSQMLGKVLKIKVRVFSRDPGSKAP